MEVPSHKVTIEFGSRFDSVSCSCGSEYSPLVASSDNDSVLQAIKVRMIHVPRRSTGVKTDGPQRGRRFKTWFPPYSPSYRDASPWA